jgi:hypothetical protein
VIDTNSHTIIDRNAARYAFLQRTYRPAAQP